jgi:hypothetical protein
MARLSVVVRNKKRAALVDKYAAKRKVRQEKCNGNSKA